MARIIYVEDDEIVADYVQETLTAAGHLVGVIAHGVLALDTIVFKRPELVILDQQLPGMTGLDILKQLRRHPATYLTPVLMLTGRQGDRLADDAAVAGVTDYLVKPFDAEDLIERVAAALAANSVATGRRLRA